MEELNIYLKDLASQIGIENFDEKKAIKFLEDKARKLKRAGSNCVAVSNETVKLWFKEYLRQPQEEPKKEEPVQEVKEEKHEDYKQINLFEL